MIFPQLSPQAARNLKILGFEQPEVSIGQVWYSLLEVPFEIQRKCNAPLVGFVTVNLNNGGERYFSGEVSEGMVYCPTIDEAYWFLMGNKGM